MATSDTVDPPVGCYATTINRWAKAAIAHAQVGPISDPVGYFATVPACRGAWAQGPTPEHAIRELEETLADWATVHLQTGNRPPLPVMGGINLNRGTQNRQQTESPV